VFDLVMLGIGGLFCPCHRLRCRLRQTVRISMLFDYVLASGVTAFLLLRPERF